MLWLSELWRMWISGSWILNKESDFWNGLDNETAWLFLVMNWLLKKVEFHLLWFCLVYIFVDRYFFYVLDSLMGMVSSVKVFFGYWIVKKGNDFSFGLDVFVLWSWYLKEDVYLSSCSFFCYVDDQWWIFW